MTTQRVLVAKKESPSFTELFTPKRVRIGNEIRWCVDALTEPGVQLNAVQQRA